MNMKRIGTLVAAFALTAFAACALTGCGASLDREAVAYTHLDVYKRQILAISPGWNENTPGMPIQMRLP